MTDSIIRETGEVEFNRHAWYGLIFRWYAVDDIGELALFESGYLPIPDRVFNDRRAYEMLDRHLRQRAPFTTARIASGFMLEHAGTGTLEYFEICKQESSKGLYFFDECDQGGWISAHSYHLVTIPEQPLMIEQLPAEIRMELEYYRLPVRFCEQRMLEIERFLHAS